MSNVGTTATISPAEAPIHNIPTIERIEAKDMDNALSIFERMANAVVGASNLVPVVEALQKDFASLKSDIEHVREQNSRLDEILTRTRSERNAAEAQVHAYKTELEGVKNVNETLHAQVAAKVSYIDELQANWRAEVEEREGWMEAALKTDADLQAANAKLAKFEEMFYAVFKPDLGSTLIKQAEQRDAVEPVQLPSREAAKEVSSQPGGTTYVETAVPSAEPQPALQTETDTPKLDEPHDIPGMAYDKNDVEVRAKPETDEATMLATGSKPWDRYGY